MTANIFLSLSRYAIRQEENYLTEAFVYLLNFLLENENIIGVEFLKKLCGDKAAHWFSAAQDISIQTQISNIEGRPDIVVQVRNEVMVFIEVKHDSSLGQKQLERYYAYLDKLPHKEKQLVLLTRSRHSVQETALDVEKFHHVCWYEVSGWLSELSIKDQTTKYLVYQFLDFLKEKEMSMEKVTWEYMEGVPAMINLANMLGTAIAEALPEEKTRKTAGWNWMGYYIGDGTEVWVGFRYKEPLKIVFENQNGNDPTFHRELSLQKVHFFSLSAGEQLERLTQFVNDAYSDYVQIQKG